MEKMVKNREYAKDPSMNKKLSDYLQAQFKKNAVRNDEKDFVPVDKLEIPVSTKE